MNYVITGGNFTSHLLYELEGHFGIEILTEDVKRLKHTPVCSIAYPV
uniref:Uncharacterized protein n=1 Tax=Candidatus Kentrum sp. LFY TaxID=2126342 RepID=A0A450UGE6_9GAMM|nr:MAG: hypothetical protein BECKLFY1418B_GA0070995_10272 [Candidatus Kentron sp. LFY]